MDRKIDDMCRMLREIDETHQVDRITLLDQQNRTKWSLQDLVFKLVSLFSSRYILWYTNTKWNLMRWKVLYLFKRNNLGPKQVDRKQKKVLIYCWFFESLGIEIIKELVSKNLGIDLLGSCWWRTDSERKTWWWPFDDNLVTNWVCTQYTSNIDDDVLK